MSEALTTWSDLPGVEAPPWRARLGRAGHSAPLWIFVALLVFGWIVLPAMVELSGRQLVAVSARHLFLYLLVRESFLFGAVALFLSRLAARRRETDIPIEVLGQALGSGIALVGRDRRVKYANGAFLRLLGTDRRTIISSPLDRALGLTLTEAQLAALLPLQGKAHAVLSAVRQGRRVEIAVEIVYRPEPAGAAWWVVFAQDGASARVAANGSAGPALTLAA
jgi:PAS domain-containing protein